MVSGRDILKVNKINFQGVQKTKIKLVTENSFIRWEFENF